MKNSFLLIWVILVTLTMACSQKSEFTADFDNTNDRIWVGKDFWSIPLEDWKVEDGKLLCIGTVPESRVNLLTRVLSPGTGDFEVSVIIGLTREGSIPGSAGLVIGAFDKEDPDVRAACYFGKGIKAGVSLHGFAFLGEERLPLPEGFDFSETELTITGNNNRLSMKATDKTGNHRVELSAEAEEIQGLIVMVNNFILGGDYKPGNSLFTFDDLSVSGSKVIEKPDNAFGPVLFTQHTLSKGTLKMLAFLPPVGEKDNQEVGLQLKKDGKWEAVATETLETDSRTALFRIDNWDASSDVEYRVEYLEKGKDGTVVPDYYAGTIRRDPVNRALKFGGLTCQFTSGYPYTPLVESLTKLDPDILYFSGDQVYEPNGGYQVKREPVDVSIVNYLGKYYMFGWAFGDLMRDRPVICTPDDHDVYHGNLWGESGAEMPPGRGTSDSPGFIQSVEMVNMVNRTQCGQLPDPYDPTPIKQGMSVWYTGLTYGRVSFAIISDRIFKTAPEAVSDWEGRHDHMKEPREDLSFLDKPGVEMIGERQTKFLNDWILDWDGADMKVLLSQTVYANVATHHGGLSEYLYGDLDSGGWPKSGRDKLINLMRKGAVFHINGDQHLPSLVQYGLKEYRDAGWSYCTPAICNFYMRWYLPDELAIPVLNRPDHGYPNTGNYEDSFGNLSYVYAVGNPGKIVQDNNSRYNNAQIRASGFGMITFDQTERSIDIDAWRFIADVENPNMVRDQFAGWPLTISQFDNLGMGAENVLPEISINKSNQLLKIWNERTGELEQVFRIQGSSVQPRLHNGGSFRIAIGEGNNKMEYSGLKTLHGSNAEKFSVEL
jgi:alkaline phosphatase D